MLNFIFKNWVVYSLTLFWVSLVTTPFVLFLYSVYHLGTTSEFSTSGIAGLFITPTLGAILGCFVTIPLGLIASLIFHFLFHTNHQSLHLFKLIGMGFGLMTVCTIIYFNEFTFTEVVLISSLFLGSGYLTGMILYRFWMDHFVAPNRG